MNEYIIGILVALGLGFLYQKNRADTASAQNENLEVKEEILKTDAKIAENNGDLKTEENKQEEIKQNLEDIKLEDTITNIVDFLNNRNKK
jgi:hypothetical protein